MPLIDPPTPPSSAPSTTLKPMEPATLSGQAILDMAHVHDLESRTLKTYWEILDLSRTRLDAERQKVKTDLEELQDREAKVSARDSAAETKLKKAEETLAAAMKESESASARENEAKRVEAANQKKEIELTPLLAQAEQIAQQLAAAKEAEQISIKASEAAEAHRQAAALELAQIATLKEEVVTIQAQSWPPSLNGQVWWIWQKDIFERAKSHASAAFVIAAFSRLCAAEKSTDPQEIVLALQELGRRLYSETGDPAQVAKIGAALNEAAAGKYQIRFAQPGQPTQDQWMNFRPGTATVQQVQNWAVFKPDSSGSVQIACKAEVQ